MSEENDENVPNSESINNRNDNKLDQIEDKTAKEVKPLINNEVIRESVVSTAVNFLLNPRVLDSPLIQKRTFLIRKGLSLEEIDSAIERAEQIRRSQTIQPKSDFDKQMMASNVPQMVQPFPSFLTRTTNFVTTVTLLSGFLYGAYVFYKRFIEPLIYDEKEKPIHPLVIIQEQLNQLTNAMNSLQKNVSTIELNIRKQIEKELLLIKSPQDLTIHELKSELSSIKSLLLNRRQFAATPIPTIPSWQRDSTDSIKDTLNNSDQLTNGSNDSLNGLSDEKQVNTDLNGFDTNKVTSNGSIETIHSIED